MNCANHKWCPALTTGILVSTWMSVPLPISFAQIRSAEKTEVARLIRQLGHEDFFKREAASQSLKAMGEPVLEPLQEAGASSNDPEIRHRANQLIATIIAQCYGGLLERLTGHQSGVFAVAISPDGHFALSGGSDDSMILWDIDVGRKLKSFHGHKSTVSCVAFLYPSGKSHRGEKPRTFPRLALSGSWDKTVRLWDLQEAREVRCFFGHTENVRSVAFSPNGEWIVSAGSDNSIRLWQTETGKQVHCFRGHTKGVWSAAFSSDGEHILSGGWDKTLRWWDIKTGKELGCLKGHTDAVRSVALSPDDHLAASASDDGTVRLWDMTKGKELCCCREHSGWVMSVAFSHDGKRLLSGGADNTMRLWSVTNPALGSARVRQLCCFQEHGAVVNSVAFSFDRKRFLSGSLDQHIFVWGPQK
jgi:WD40 repeat protein